MRIADFLRQEEQREELGQEIYFPEWRCFCCNDTGFIKPRDFFSGNILERILRRNVAIACTCPAGAEKGDGVARFDDIDFDTCQRIHVLKKQQWSQTAQEKAEVAQQAKEAMARLKMNMPAASPEPARLSVQGFAAIEATLAPSPVAVASPPVQEDEEDLPF
jgi:hypothetical protein